MDFARQLARIAADLRAEDVVLLDLRGVSAIADFFVIATGDIGPADAGGGGSDRGVRPLGRAARVRAERLRGTRPGC